MRRGLLILGYLLLTPILAMGAQQVEVDEVVQRLKETREKIEDFSADLLQEKKIFLLKDKVISRGRIRFKKPDLFFIEFFNPEWTQMIFDGKTLLLYFKEEKMAERYQVHANPIVEKYLLFSKDPFQEKVASWKIVEDLGPALVIEILPKVKEVLFVKTRIWASKKDWMVVGMEMVERNGDTTFLRYSNMKINTGLKDSDFKIRLPKDVKITEVK